jgi:hypothetical protein
LRSDSEAVADGQSAIEAVVLEAATAEVQGDTGWAQHCAFLGMEIVLGAMDQEQDQQDQ